VCSELLFKNLLHRGKEAAGLLETTGQVNALVQFFLEQQRKSSQRVYFNLDFDGDDQCRRIFCMTEAMVEAFRHDGQFLIMDATCKTTHFAMQLVLIVGINQTLETTLFAIGLIGQEDIDSYTWVLRAVKAAVGQSAIRTIHDLNTYQCAYISRTSRDGVPLTCLAFLCISHVSVP
jgi:hypothetical protein